MLTIAHRRYRGGHTCKARGPVKLHNQSVRGAGTKAPTARYNRSYELDELHRLVWEAVRRLFPPTALASMPNPGCIFITWSIKDQPDALHPYASPIMLRLDTELIDLLRASSAKRRQQLAADQEAVVRAGMVGYDPYERLPNSRVIVLG
jgi:hypothetical protein